MYTIGRHRDNPSVFTIEEGDHTDAYKHPASPYSYVCCSKYLFGGKPRPDLEFPMTIDLRAPGEPVECYLKCETLQNMSPNISERPLILPTHTHDSQWYDRPLENTAKQIPVTFAVDKEGGVWVVDRSTMEDSIHHEDSNVKCITRHHRLSEADYNWLQDHCFKNAPKPWCVTCAIVDDSMPYSLKLKLYNLCTAPPRVFKHKKLLYDIPGK